MMMKKIAACLMAVVMVSSQNIVMYQNGVSEDSNEAEWAEHISSNILKLKSESVEYILPDGRRVDIFDKENGVAYEVDWCKKYAEGIGQSLGYAIATNCDPGLILLYKNGEDEYYNTALGIVSQLRERGYKYKLIVLNVQSGKVWKF